MITDEQVFNKLRRLDVDDLLILSLLSEKCRSSEISKFLYLTPPAVTHRSNKYINIFGSEIFVTVGQRKVLSDTGKLLADKAKKALCIFMEVAEDFSFTQYLSRETPKTEVEWKQK